MTQAHVTKHPLVAHYLSQLRDERTPPTTFRQLVGQLTFVQCIEAMRDLELEAIDVKTPLTPTRGFRLKHRLAVVPILRAGLGMVEAVLAMAPWAEVRHLGIYRDERTLEPVEYYHKLPSDDPPDVGMIVDPMLATGGSATAAIEALKRWGVPRIKQVSLLAAPEGIAHVNRTHPDVQIYVCAVDERLNDKGYIVPGLGDAGDRIFGTV
ncbi:MAG: uracil phosphoribosyltransferase [Planctomycetes bacterium]|nr:uracil phosphoribosyltransferase [Planctomycetota bacterium]